MGTAHKASEELHNLQKKDVSTIAAAIDEMRYNEVKSIATKDSERIEQLTADVKALARGLKGSQDRVQELEDKLQKSLSLESESMMGNELRVQQEVLERKKIQKQLMTLEHNMTERLNQLEAVVRENNSRCLLLEEEVQVMRESMEQQKVAQTRGASNTVQIKILNEEINHLRARLNAYQQALPYSPPQQLLSLQSQFQQAQLPPPAAPTPGLGMDAASAGTSENELVALLNAISGAERR
eukprot:g2238.t1